MTVRAWAQAVATGDGHRFELLARAPVNPAAGLLWLPALGVPVVPIPGTKRGPYREENGAADALVTDYSSVLFDAASLDVPVVKLV